MGLIYSFVETTSIIITVTAKMKTISCLEIRSLMSFVYQQKSKIIEFSAIVTGMKITLIIAVKYYIHLVFCTDLLRIG